jgi:CRP/FNR family cyclic AMP-dependent transcriptional regulator
MDITEIRRTLKHCELFGGLEEPDVEKIAALCQVQTYRAGEYVFHQGDFGDRIFIIADGHIYLERTIDLGTRKGKAVIDTLGKGRAFGCWSSILNEPHHLMSSAICKKPARIVAMNGTSLREIMFSDPKLGLKIMEKTCLLLRDRIQGALGALEKI